MDNKTVLLSFCIVPLFFILLQYYGFPLLDRISLYLWKSAKQRIQTRIQKRKQEYEQLVELMFKDNDRNLHKYEIQKVLVILSVNCLIVLLLLYISFQLSILLVSVAKDDSFKLSIWGMLFLFYLGAWVGIWAVIKLEKRIKAINDANKRDNENQK